jgi:hypothetical protein
VAKGLRLSGKAQKGENLYHRLQKKAEEMAISAHIGMRGSEALHQRLKQR